tara:strand:+ start:3690 stop:4961 length:1272 start_codon:yes stop_codon:yes gene_type:complete
MPAYSPDNLKRIVLELTANCNAMCPGCDRWNKGKGGINSVVEKNLGTKGHMSLRKFNNAIPNELFIKYNNFRRIEFNGSVGDAILHPKFIKFLKLINNKNDQFREERDRVAVRIATNAGLHGKKYWEELGKQVARSNALHNMIYVALDGTTNDTHQQYRRGVDYNKALDNARYAIDAGAKVRWQFIEFEHNKHQKEEAIRLAEKYGFTDIEIRNSRLGNSIYGDWVTRMQEEIKEPNKSTKAKFERDISKSISKQRVRQAAVEKEQKVRVEKKIDKKLQTQIKYRETDEMKKMLLKDTKNITDVKTFLEETTISCQWAGHGSVNVEFDGTVHPCCHMNQGLFYPNNPRLKYYHDVNNLYDSGWNNLENYNLVQILSHPYFTRDLEDSWKPDSDPNKKFKRLPVCLETCSKKQNIYMDEVTQLG